MKFTDIYVTEREKCVINNFTFVFCMRAVIMPVFPQSVDSFIPLSRVLASRFLAVLQRRFAAHSERHPFVSWSAVQARLLLQPKKLAALYAMEKTGGEPDLIALDPTSSAYSFFDCSADSPSGRRFLCYDACGQFSAMGQYTAGFVSDSVRGNVLAVASAMGISVLTPEDYKFLQGTACFDKKTANFLWTSPEDKKRHGPFVGYFFGGKVRIQRHCDTYYSADMGFRGKLDL